MTDRQIENRIKKLQEIEMRKKELETQANELKTEIKAALEERETEELKIKNFIVRWKEIISNSLDSKALKATYPDIYKQFTKQSTSKRFTIA